MRVLLTIFLSVCLCASRTIGQVGAWTSSDPGFRALNIVPKGETLWLCGAGERIASSPDGKNWQIRHSASTGGAMLLGIGFTSETFGFAYGSGGVVLTTENGGGSWTAHQLGTETILQASFSSVGHGVVRTRSGLFYLNGSDNLTAVVAPSGTVDRFKFVESVVALTDDKMGALISEGPYSEGGYLTTSDGGKTWKFFDPPSTGILSLIGVDGKYWASGHEVIGKDKPGGGYGVPMAAWSDDGQTWTHVSDDIRPCHWENCGVCNTSGCLASGSLLVNFFHSPVQYSSIPKGSLSAKWASIPGLICSIIQGGVSCAELSVPSDLIAAPATPRPSEQGLGPLTAKPASGDGLRCIACSLEPVYVDDKVEGRFKVHVSFVVRADGTMAEVAVQNAPSPALQQKLQLALQEWLFEPPVKDGNPINAKTQSDLAIMVMRSR